MCARLVGDIRRVCILYGERVMQRVGRSHHRVLIEGNVPLYEREKSTVSW